MTAKELIDSFKILSEKISNNPKLNTFITTFTQQRATYQSNPTAHVNAIIQQIEILKGELSFLYTLDTETKAILKSYNFDKFTSPDYLSQIQNSIRSNPPTAFNTITALIQEINQFKVKPQQIYTLLQPISFEDVSLNTDEAFIEITFDGDVSINDFVSGKEQFGEWFQILDGYSRFLNCAKEDFHIFSITKSSPAKFKIKTKLEYAAIVLTIVTGLIQIEQRVTQDRLIIEQIKNRDLVSDTLHKKYIKEAEENLTKKIDAEITRLILNESDKKPDIDGEVKGFFKKSVEQQHAFIINGGDVRIYLGDPSKSQQTEQLELLKHEIKNLKGQISNLQLPEKPETKTE